ncbi:MAG: PD40 domain-containing protein [Deltaproteobacteria bacterium]|nr:PD40 domain-containing protein [Deltaproteobacteria bacterium]
MNRTRLTLFAALALAAGCSKPSTKPKGLGKPLVSVAARNLALSPDGKTLVFVGEVQPPPEKEVPEGVFQGVLTTVPVAGGVPRQLGGGVSTLEDSFRLSPDGKSVAYLQAFRFRDQSGNLHVAPLPAGEAKQVAQQAKYYKYSPDGRWLGYVAGGEMHLYELESGADRLVATSAATFEFAKDSQHLLVRRPLTVGGDLLLAQTASPGEPAKIGQHVGDYGFSPDGTQVAFTARKGGPSKPYAIFLGPIGGPYQDQGEGVASFSFSPDSKWVAYTDGLADKLGTVNLQVVAAGGGVPKQVGENVVEYRWSPSSQAVALRENNEDKGRRWTAIKLAKVPGTVVHKSSWSPHERMDKIPMVWSSDGEHLAFVHLVPKPEPKVHLYQVKAEGGDAQVVADWVFGFQYSPDGRELWYRSDCGREGRSCDLMAVSAVQPGAQPRILVRGIGGFRASAKGERLLLWYVRPDTDAAVDLGWIDLNAKQPSKGVDQYALPGAQFVDSAGTGLVYLVGERKREGVYFAELK